MFYVRLSRLVHGNGICPWDGTVDLKFVPNRIVGNFLSYSRKFLNLNTIIMYSQARNQLGTP